jgi:hypothetical protein
MKILSNTTIQEEFIGQSCAYNLLSWTFDSAARFHKIHAQILTTDAPALLQNNINNTTNFYAPAVHV